MQHVSRPVDQRSRSVFRLVVVESHCLPRLDVVFAVYSLIGVAFAMRTWHLAGPGPAAAFVVVILSVTWLCMGVLAATAVIRAVGIPSGESLAGNELGQFRGWQALLQHFVCRWPGYLAPSMLSPEFLKGTDARLSVAALNGLTWGLPLVVMTSVVLAACALPREHAYAGIASFGSAWLVAVSLRWKWRTWLRQVVTG